MRHSSNNSSPFKGYGAIIGAAAALIATVMLMRKRRPSEYLSQSGEGAGENATSIQFHDEKTFRDEVARANI